MDFKPTPKPDSFTQEQWDRFMKYCKELQEYNRSRPRSFSFEDHLGYRKDGRLSDYQQAMLDEYKSKWRTV